MSMTHDGAPIVQLESQQQLLDNLQQMIRLDSNLICVAGKKGAGKSWLAQRFLNTDSAIQTLSFLICLPSQTAEQQRSVLLGQLLSDSFCTGEETLTESLGTFRGEQECKATIVVDDANLLTHHLLDELAQLVLEAQNQPLWQINVILFANPDLIDEASLTTLPKPDFKHLVIEPFRPQEVNDFLEQLVIPAHHVDSEKKQQAIYQAAQKVEAYPGNLYALAEKHRPPVVCWVKRSLIAIIILLLALGGWSWWTSYQARVQDQMLDAGSQKDEQQVAPTDESATTDASSSAQSTLSSQSESTQQDDALPPSVTEKTLTVGDETNGEQKRVVVPANVVDALLNGESPKSAKVSQEDVQNLPATNYSSIADGNLTLASEALLAIPEQRYTLQLAAVTEEEEAINFLKMYDLDGKVRIYRTLRGQQPWYIITYKDFASIQETREAIQELSLALQKEQPWPKSMAQVHQEIEKAK
ncbi:SPOR domain-containing protein [Vibrio aphrogenes]|uniref:SPOR domain-containing protein n=1 Tax=Vibrio aphrogenes TaxID=1891186 RepID=UPI000B34FBD6|nr:AAA family ATPase [Vibrio aphrogenes]